jgi:hypothetical protein
MKILQTLAVLTAALIACRLSAALDENEIREFVKKRAASQVGDPYLWDAANSGGYLFHFSADIDGDGRMEDFLGSTMMFNKNSGLWNIYSEGKLLGVVNLSSNRFLIIRKESSTHLPYGVSVSATMATVVDQVVADGRIKVEERAVSPDALESLNEEWKKSGQEIQPKISAILLMDFVKGGREWKPVNLMASDHVFHGGGHFVLKSDEARLASNKLTPEAVLQALTEE